MGSLRPEPLGWQPLVSIVTPTLNQAAFLPDTLRSVARQSYPRIEHILVDGGSSDGTVDLLRDWQESQITWTSGSDRGMYDAINKGLRNATGDVIAYLNSDDILLPDAVRLAVSTLDRTNADLVFGDGLRSTPDGQFWTHIVPSVKPRVLVGFGTLLQPSVFWRRTVIDEVGYFDDGYRYVGDLEYWLRVTARCRTAKVRDILSVYRDHPGALTHTGRERMRAEETAVRRLYGLSATLPQVVAALPARSRYEGAARRETVRFALAVRAHSRGWRGARALGLTIHWPRFVLTMLPVVGRRMTRSWLRIARPPLPQREPHA